MYRSLPLLIGLAAVALAQQPGVNFYSAEKEAALGAQLAKAVLRETPPLASDSIQQYVAVIGNRLYAEFPDSTHPLTFTVVADTLDHPASLPVALPGGYVFLPAGVFLESHDEDELAGLLAQAMQRFVLSSTRRRQSPVVNYGNVPLVFLGGWLPDGNPRNLPIAWQKYELDLDLDADAAALPILQLAVYDPAAFLRYLARVRPPVNAVRLVNLEQAIKQLPPTEYPLHEALAAIQKELTLLIHRPSQPPTLKRPGEK